MKNVPKLWSDYAGQYRQDVQNRIDLAEPSKTCLLQRLKALETSWPDAAAYKAAPAEPTPTLPGFGGDGPDSGSRQRMGRQLRPQL
jgi:hypothetical protein